MIFNLQNDNEVLNYKDKSAFYIKNGNTVDLIKKKNTRTTKQSSSLHLLYTIIASKLNDVGMDFKYFGLKGQVISTRHNTNTVKEHIWRPIQKALFNIESTKKINTEHINEIVDVLANYFGEKGIVIEFPSKEQLKKLLE